MRNVPYYSPNWDHYTDWEGIVKKNGNQLSEMTSKSIHGLNVPNGTFTILELISALEVAKGHIIPLEFCIELFIYLGPRKPYESEAPLESKTLAWEYTLGTKSHYVVKITNDSN